jgi:hypothetical protein
LVGTDLHVGQCGADLEVFDKTTGALLAQVALPANAQGALMTDMVRGKQCFVLPVAGANIPRRARRAQPALSRLAVAIHSGACLDPAPGPGMVS